MRAGRGCVGRRRREMDPRHLRPFVRLLIGHNLAVTDADQMSRRDRAVASAHLIGISDSKVVTDKQSYERTQVAWIHLASTTANASPPGSHTPAPAEARNFV